MGCGGGISLDGDHQLCSPLSRAPPHPPLRTGRAATAACLAGGRVSTTKLDTTTLSLGASAAGTHFHHLGPFPVTSLSLRMAGDALAPPGGTPHKSQHFHPRNDLDGRAGAAASISSCDLVGPMAAVTPRRPQAFVAPRMGEAGISGGSPVPVREVLPLRGISGTSAKGQCQRHCRPHHRATHGKLPLHHENHLYLPNGNAGLFEVGLFRQGAVRIPAPQGSPMSPLRRRARTRCPAAGRYGRQWTLGYVEGAVT